MIHLYTKENLENYCKISILEPFFIGFNAFTPVEEKLVRTLLQWDKADIFFHADEYISMTKDKKQESFSMNTKLGKNLMILEISTD